MLGLYENPYLQYISMVEYNEYNKMEDGITFDEDRKPQRAERVKPPKLTQMIIDYSGGYIQNQKQANYVLMGFIVAMVVLSFFLFSGSGADIPRAALENPE